MYGTVSPTDAKNEQDKFVNVFESGPTVFKRLSAVTPTQQIENSK